MEPAYDILETEFLKNSQQEPSYLVFFYMLGTL